MVGIICEYNPFHYGHIYHIKKIKEMFKDETIVLILAGNFLNRGDVSVIGKYNKTNIALNYVDLVIELPFVFATQSADIYAYGAINILNKLKCDYLVFGSESNDINLLTKIAKFQLENKLILNKYIKEGFNYPTALSKIIKENLNIKIDSPNDLLGISYIKEIIKLNSNIKPITIKRTNDYHDLKPKNKITSATSIRNLIYQNKDISNYVPYKDNVKNINLNNFYLIIKHKILTEDLTIYQDIDNNLNNKLKKVINKSNNIDDLIMLTKSKNYTYNKIKRSLVHILCCMKRNNYKLEYIRILGFNNKGKNYLNKIKKDIDIPLITNYNKLLDYEILVDKIYNLINNEEYKFPIIKA